MLPGMFLRRILIFTIALAMVFAACAKRPLKSVPQNAVNIRLEEFSKDGSNATVTIATPKIAGGRDPSPSIKGGRHREVRVLLVPVRLQGGRLPPAYATIGWFNDMMFGKVRGPDDRCAGNSAANYFDQASMGHVHLKGNVYPEWVEIGTSEHYQAIENKNNMPTQMVSDAIAKIKASKLSGYDFVICLVPGGLWPIYRGGWYEQVPNWQDPSGQFKGYLIMDIPVDGPQEPKVLKTIYASTPTSGLIHNWWFGSFLHELMHGIAPLASSSNVSSVADLYQMPYENLGQFDLMSGGNHNSVVNYNEPAYFSGWTKARLGYAKPELMRPGSRKKVTLEKQLIKVPLSAGRTERSYFDRKFSGEEYLLIEYRSKTAKGGRHNFDSGIEADSVVAYYAIEDEKNGIGNDHMDFVRRAGVLVRGGKEKELTITIPPVFARSD